jgi:hypothetical protein
LGQVAHLIKAAGLLLVKPTIDLANSVVWHMEGLQGMLQFYLGKSFNIQLFTSMGSSFFSQCALDPKPITSLCIEKRCHTKNKSLPRD